MGFSWNHELRRSLFARLGMYKQTGLSVYSTVRAAIMNAFRTSLSSRLRALSVEERAWPGRNDGFASLHYKGKEFAHFHNWTEIDIRLGKNTIKREQLVRSPHSTVHPGRADSSPWYEMTLGGAADVEEAIRLIKIAIQGLVGRK